MTNYSEQLKVVKRFKVHEGEHRRVNCPFCNGWNTLSITNQGGILEWYCFKASCDVRGISEEGRSLNGLSSSLNRSISNRNDSGADSGIQLGHPIPDLRIDPLNSGNTKPMEYLESVHAREALERRLVDIFYAPAPDRILFSVANGKGYSGRRLGSYGPKWIKYGDTSHLFTCGTGKTGVLVEDAPSACAVGVISDYTGLSLLGTILTSQHKIDLRKYDNLIVCLDPDAARKSISLSSQLQGILPTTVKLIADDLKYYNPEQIRKMLK